MLLVFDVSSVFPFITLPSKSASTLFPYPQKIQKLECCVKFLPLSDLLNPVTVVPPLSAGDTFQDPQWMPEITNSTEPLYDTMFLSASLFLHFGAAIK